MKLCKDCRWGHCLHPEEKDYPMYWECHHDSAHITQPTDLVVGRPAKPGWLPCSEARIYKKDYKTNKPLCGPDGRFWEPKLSGIIGFGEALDDEDC